MAEKRLIDANALITKLNNLEAVDGKKEQRDVVNALLAYLPNIVDRTPTVDAVEVVRCKDCKKWLKVEPSGTKCRVCADSTKIRLPYDFCSYGERRTDGR